MIPSTKVPGDFLSADDIHYVLDLVRDAGDLTVKMRQGVGIAEKTGPFDRVTEADLAASVMLVAGLKRRFPDDTVISEEDQSEVLTKTTRRLWLIDPIDGTYNYIANDGQYSIMIGLIIDCRVVFGWVHAPILPLTYYGGPISGAWSISGGNGDTRLQSPGNLSERETQRLMMGFRDRKGHPQIMSLPGVEFVKAGSIGLKVAKIINDEADMFVHLSGKLKLWDTAAPVALAIGAGLDVGQLDSDGLRFQIPPLEHCCPVIIGRPGTLAWARRYLKDLR